MAVSTGITLAQFRTRVSRKLGLDTTPAGADEVAVDDAVNDGIEDILLRTHCKVIPATVTLTATTKDYTLDTAILAISDAYLTSAGVDYLLQRVSPDEILAYRANSTATSPPRLYAVTGSNALMVYPTPTAADTVTIYYVPRPTILTVSAVPSEIPFEWHKLVELYALGELADYDDDQSSAQGTRYRQMYDDGIRRMRRTIFFKGGHTLPRAKIRSYSRLLIQHDHSIYPQ